MVGRPKEFEETEAPERAMDVFWAQGYEATSVQDLLDAMGINRGSLYDTFGDKRALFLAAIDHYGHAAGRRIEECLGRSASPLAGIRRLLSGMGSSAGGNCRGCLMTNSIVELAPHDPDVAEASRRMLKSMEKGFAAALEQAVEAGELPRRTDVRAAARFLVSTTQGLVVMAKASASPVVVRDTVNVAMAALAAR